MKIEQKDLVLLSYPFTNLKNSKVRPGLVISKNYLNSKSDDCILLPLTTVIKDDTYSILITQKDLSSGKLIKNSCVRIDKVFSVEKKLVRKAT